MDWVYKQIIGFLANFFAEMGNMGAEMFEMSWVQSIVLFFSYLAWILYAVGFVVACAECGLEYSSGRADIKGTAMNLIKGFMAVSLFTVVPIRLYELCVSLQANFGYAISGAGASFGTVAGNIIDELTVENFVDFATTHVGGFGSVTSPIMVLFCIILMAYAVIKVFFANLKRGGILLIQIAVGSLYMFSVPRGYLDGFYQWCKQVVGLCLTAFLQATILIAGLTLFNEHANTRIAGAFGWTLPHARICPARFTRHKRRSTSQKPSQRPMADKKNLCAMIPADLHARVRQEQEQSGKTLSEFVEQLITDYYKMKEGTKMTGDMRTMAIQLPEELFERLKAYLKKNNLKQKQFIIGLIEDALEQDEEDTTAQAGSENASETEEPDEPDMDAEEE